MTVVVTMGLSLDDGTGFCDSGQQSATMKVLTAMVLVVAMMGLSLDDGDKVVTACDDRAFTLR